MGQTAEPGGTLIRKITEADYPAADRLLMQLHQLHVDGRPDLYTPLEHLYSFEEFRQLVCDERSICLLAAAGDTVLGLCIAVLKEKSGMCNIPIAYVEAMIVDESFRKAGVAARLFHAAEAEARAHGARRLDLMVWAFNQNAIDFYQSLGMTMQRMILEKPIE